VDKVKFEFCPLWNGFVKVAIFFQQKSAMSYSIVNADGTADIPNSILKMSGKIYISVVGVNGTDKTRTTNILSYDIGDGVVDAVKPEDFPGDEDEAYAFYNNILEMCSTMLNAFEIATQKLDDVYTKSETSSQIQSYAYSKSEVDSKVQTAQTGAQNYTYSRTDIDSKIQTAVSEHDDKIINDFMSFEDHIMEDIDPEIARIDAILSDHEKRIRSLEK
jgi:hypothetical protein